MADAKISALTSATTPLAGTEVLPIVQSGTTKKVSVDNLTAGKVISANGIAFPATQVASSDPNTLDDYEEGTWTPVVKGGSTAGTYETQTNIASYTKVGRLVTVQAYIKLASVITAGGTGLLVIAGLPFAKRNPSSWGAGVVFTNNVDYAGVSLAATFATDGTGSQITIIGSNDNAGWGYSQISGVSANDEICFTLQYEV